MNGCKPAKSDMAGSVKEREYRADISRNNDLKRMDTHKLHFHGLLYCCASSAVGACAAAAVAAFNWNPRWTLFRPLASGIIVLALNRNGVIPEGGEREKKTSHNYV